MAFDLTKDAALDAKNYHLYRILQAALYLLALLSAFYLGYRIAFPSASFSFSFTTLSGTAPANGLRDMNHTPLPHGQLTADQDSSFDTSLGGNFSKAAVNFSLDSKSTKFNNASVKVIKSYEAFLYPEGEPVGFKNGTLLKNRSDYYLVSDGLLRKFSSPNLLPSLGYSQDAFMTIAPEELQYNQLGDPITSNNDYANDSLFKIADNYYMLDSGSLKKFTSLATFLDQYQAVQAIEKNANFLEKYPSSDDQVGFSNGSLISYGNGIYIVSQGLIFPINDPVTFANKGFDFKNVQPASADEIALYKKGKIFTITSPHPDGTIFKTDAGKYYLIQNEKKHPLPSDSIARSWQNHSIIPVSEKSLEISASCNVKKDFFSLRSYSCEIPLATLQNLDGANYEFSIRPDTNIKLDSIDVTFVKDANYKNLRSTLSIIFNGIKGNYVQTPTN